MTLVFGAALIAGVVMFIITQFWPAVVVTGLLTGLLMYMFMPVLSYDFSGIWMLSIVVLAAGAAVTIALQDTSRKTVGGGVVCLGITGVIALVFMLGGVFTTAPMFRADSYASILPKPSHVSFEKAMQRLDTGGHPLSNDATVIDQNDVRLVDSTLAERRAQELLGRDPEFGGTYSLGTMQLTRRNGRLVWAAPMDFRGLTRWASSSGSPAYVWVDAHDSKDAGLVKEVAGKPIAMRCLTSSWFGDNIERAVWTGGFAFTGLTDYSFELDNEGRPMYVLTAYAHRVGFSGSDPTGVVVFDPQACYGRRYELKDVPAWVNRVVPSDMINDQIAWQGEYVHGWWNANFGAHADILEPTPGIELVSTARNGATAWYLGLSTTGNPNGTVGFMLVDSRTKETVYFEQSGATEAGARDAIMGKLAEKRGWNATWPILYNIGGRPTYLTTIKDGAGNFKGVGMMPVDDRNIVVVADDLKRALQAYQQALAGSGNGTGGIGGGEPDVVIDGHVLRFASEVIDGNTVYYIVLTERPGTVLTATSRIGPQVALTAPGDSVQVHAAADTGSGTLAVRSMMNTSAIPLR